MAKYYRKKRQNTKKVKKYNPKTKRWYFSAEASYLGAKGKITLGNRNLKRAVEQIIETQKEDNKIFASIQNTFKQNTLYTQDVLQVIQKTTDGSLGLSGGYRFGDTIQPQFLRIKGDVNFYTGASTITGMCLLVKSNQTMLNGTSGNLYSGFGSSTLYQHTNSYNLTESILDTKKIKVIKVFKFSHLNKLQDSKEKRAIDWFYRFPKSDYKYITGLAYGSQNYHLIWLSHIIGGVTGTTSTFDVNATFQLQYDNKK